METYEDLANTLNDIQLPSDAVDRDVAWLDRLKQQAKKGQSLEKEGKGAKAFRAASILRIETLRRYCLAVEKAFWFTAEVRRLFPDSLAMLHILTHGEALPLVALWNTAESEGWTAFPDGKFHFDGCPFDTSQKGIIAFSRYVRDPPAIVDFPKRLLTAEGREHFESKTWNSVDVRHHRYYLALVEKLEDAIVTATCKVAEASLALEPTEARRFALAVIAELLLNHDEVD